MNTKKQSVYMSATNIKRPLFNPLVMIIVQSDECLGEDDVAHISLISCGRPNDCLV